MEKPTKNEKKRENAENGTIQKSSKPLAPPFPATKKPFEIFCKENKRKAFMQRKKRRHFQNS